MNVMQVELHARGGFAPAAMREQWTVDSSRLSSQEADDLRRMVEQALTETPPPLNPRARDVMRYELQIDRDGRQDRIVACDGGLTPHVSALIQLVRRLGGRGSRPTT